MIKFQQISDAEDPDEDDTHYRHDLVGVLAFDSHDNWQAARPDILTIAGTGPIEGIPRGTWICDLDYEKTKGLSEGVRGLTLRAGKWMRLSLEDIRVEWGISSDIDAQNVGFVSEVLNRVYGLSQDVLFATPEIKPSEIGRLQRRMRQAPTLATGLLDLHLNAIDASRPSSKPVQTALSRTQRSAMRFQFDAPGPDEIDVRIHVPRHDHAVSIAAEDVPSAHGWERATRSDSMSTDAFIDELRGTGRPVILRGGSCEPRSQRFPPREMQVFANGRLADDAKCTHFLLEEIDTLAPWYEFRFDSAYVGSKWVPSAIGETLQVLEGVCGNSSVMSNSWSAGVLCENLLASSMRYRDQKETRISVEGLWVGLKDRIRMIRHLRNLSDCGAIPIAGYLGNMVIRAPRDPEILSMIMMSAWQSGLVITPGDAVALRDLGVDLPLDRENWGGKDVDYLYSALAYKGSQKALLSLDRTMDAPVGKRAEIMGQLLKR